MARRSAHRRHSPRAGVLVTHARFRHEAAWKPRRAKSGGNLSLPDHPLLAITACIATVAACIVAYVFTQPARQAEPHGREAGDQPGTAAGERRASEQPARRQLPPVAAMGTPPRATEAGAQGSYGSDRRSAASTEAQRSQPSQVSAGQPSGQEPRVDGYVFDGKLGSGGQGTVWRARRQTDPDAVVAIKICEKENAREMENLEALSGLQHPNIVQYIDFWKRESRSECALIMAYVDGMPLSTHLQHESGGKRSLKWDEASTVMHGILSGLKCLHTMQGGAMLHRDVKPDNVMLKATPVTNVADVILVDFGLSKRMDVGQTVTAGERMIGTPAYLSPEVLAGMSSRDFDSRVDVWAAGVVFYEMLAGELPFSGENPYALIEAIRSDDVKRVGAAGAGGNRFVSKSLAKKRDARFQDASEMLAVFELVCKDRHSVPEQLSESHTETMPRSGQQLPSAEPAAGPGGPTRETSGPQQTTAQGKPVIEGFFCKRILDKKQLRRDYEKLEKGDAVDKEQQLRELNQLIMDSVESIDVHKEAQELQSSLSGGRRVFEVCINSQPSFDTFSRSMRSARERNVRLLHLSGHGGSRCGFFWLKDQAVSTEYEEISIDKFVGILRTEVAGANGGSIECVVLNACETEDMGKKLRSTGVSHVVCWRSEVQDNTAREFALQFYASLNEQDPLQRRDYQRAFRHAVARIGPGGAAARAPMKHLADGAVDYVCFLSEGSMNGGEFPDTGFIRADDDGCDDDTRSLNNDKGSAELAAFAALGFDPELLGKITEGVRKHEAKTLLDPAEYGLEYSTYGTRLVYLSKSAVKKLFGSSKLKGYVHECSRPNCDVCQAGESLWQRNGPICQRARHTQAKKVRDAIKHLKKSLQVRTSTSRCIDACRHSHKTCGHCQMLLCIERCVGELKSLHPDASTRAPAVPT